ncbi:SF1B family DNA helicase RecD2 [Clostridium luticellarii]|jgi:exodeoxyribonuclease V alpha subunit|uniref:ATP-dependent RecD2 DNA helicase n=1 Tax=Clostridium luticellarii TaxID=1691940 RepID=A0A2T0BQN1_9CLOT|nr:ATP-dependent RecD-like DNA helicase [Clostridium luticellarii]MCI1945323.1 ATP-dependent RecD-like DNA helicase [Clostridium luticellarii]MCI1968616.1 ATP-dependent RecD-like DNA helicase [Clostridium luticellarii]MCI1995796.1 ATP-dependent RecD-like DNA helicase [Clostridium luticellarii]MCI2040090.1 ATP-dependent RecD-like DNA helicase [Clostridium luticellarii]PRR86188.1 ATP-dependent RecD-like DNA helicase [Clostridium luticellarii]
MQDLQGTIEDIIFQNKDNGYVVAKMKEKENTVTIVGCIPYIAEGKNLKVMGEWVLHPQFGRQFKVKASEEIVPDTITGIERYLSSGIISGIGPVTARKIVKKFGKDTLHVLDDDIKRLREIEGIGDKKIALIAESYSRQNEIRNIMIFLQTYGVTPNQCVKIHKKFGADSIGKVKENPYILTEEIGGIGFKTADRIAGSLGIKKNSSFRIQSGIRYVVNQFCSLGNTYMPIDRLIKEGEDILKVTREELEVNIYEDSINGKIKLEKQDDKLCVFPITYYYCELSVTKKILTLAFSSYKDIGFDVNKEIKNFEDKNNIKFAPSQKEAIEGAVKNGVEIITGGPGTGKTTIINCIIQLFEKANCKVLMGAPTGRAAKRMSEATEREAKTIHRLLEMGVESDEEAMFFSRGEESPLKCDVVIIDEASMIDIMLMNNLLKAISVGTRLIIVGDAQQLPSVGPGNVLRDFIDSGCIKVVRLKEIFRQSKESMIIVNAHRINSGEMPILNKKLKDFYFINCREPSAIMDTLIGLIDRRLPNFNKNWNKMQHIQILSPMRKGILGISNLNSRLQEVLNPKSSEKKEKKSGNTVFRTGDRVMQIKNDYTLKWTGVSEQNPEEGIGIFNGDFGYIQSIDEEKNTLTVVFDEDKKVVYDNMHLDELELSYAITIHKSQGSEFPVIILPIFMGPPLLMNRNLLYTAITRAKQMVVLVGDLKALSFMINNNKSFERYSLLKYRIMDIMESETDATVE